MTSMPTLNIAPQTLQAERVAVPLRTLREQEVDQNSRGKLEQAQRAWKVLAEKVLRLADRNADLEQVHGYVRVTRE